MHTSEYLKWSLKAAFFIFMTAAAWQDAGRKSIALVTFTAAGAVGLFLRGGQFLIEGVKLAALAEIFAGVLIGIFLLGLSALTKGAIGNGDGWFFIVSGVYLGFWKNLLLLVGSLLVCFPVGAAILIRGLWKGERTGNIRLPFLPFAFLAGVGVLLL